MRSAPVPLAQHWRGKFIKQLENAETVFLSARQGTSSSTMLPQSDIPVTPVISAESQRSGASDPWQIFFVFQFTKELYLRRFTNTFLHLTKTLQCLLSCAPDVSLQSKDNVSHLITKPEAAARMLHWMDHGQGQMLREKVDFTKEHFNLILDKKSRFYCGNLWQIYLQRHFLSVFL